MKKVWMAFVFMVIFLQACQPQGTALPSPQSSPATETLIPTETALPSATATQTPTMTQNAHPDAHGYVIPLRRRR